MSNNGPDICPRCGGVMLMARWPGEGSCLQCGYWYYGNGHNGNGHNGNGAHHFPTLLAQTTPYLIKTEHQAEGGISQEIPPVEELPSPYDTPTFKAFIQFLRDCAASNGGCEHCQVKRKCRALYDQGALLEGQGHFNLSNYRSFTRKVQNLQKTS